MFNQRILLFTLLIVAFSASLFSQTPQLLKRTTTKTEKFDFGSGGTVAIVGAPNGSIRVVGSAKNEVEITSEIEIQAGNEADLAKIAAVTGYVTEESAIRTGIISVGTHDKQALKKTNKKFPKNLIGLPFRIDYVIHVPRYCDLEIDGGKGDLTVSGVDGSMRIKFLDSNAKLELNGGVTIATFGSGTVDVAIGVQTWRGRSADIQLGTGNMHVRLPSNMSAEIDATILRTGAIENTFPDLKPRDRKAAFTEKAIIAKAGAGGVPLKFTVGEGTMKMERLVLPL